MRWPTLRRRTANAQLSAMSPFDSNGDIATRTHLIRTFPRRLTDCGPVIPRRSAPRSALGRRPPMHCRLRHRRHRVRMPSKHAHCRASLGANQPFQRTLSLSDQRQIVAALGPGRGRRVALQLTDESPRIISETSRYSIDAANRSQSYVITLYSFISNTPRSDYDRLGRRKAGSEVYFELNDRDCANYSMKCGCARPLHRMPSLPAERAWSWSYTVRKYGSSEIRR